MKFFRPKLFTAMKGYKKEQLINDLIAGLIVAIIAGLLLAFILFMKRTSEVTNVRRWDGRDEGAEGGTREIPDGTLIYEYNGPMFFAGADKILEFAV